MSPEHTTAASRGMPRGPGPGSRPADGGLFGPSSVSWRLHADPLIGLAALRAQLLQMLHPVAAQALHHCPATFGDPWVRLARTTRFVGVTTYGSAGEALVSAARLRAEKAAARALDPISGQSVGLDEPELLGWLHCCRVDSVVRVLPRAGTRLSAIDADRYVVEQVRVAALVGLDPAEVPHDVAGLEAQLSTWRCRLRAGEVARQEARWVIAPAGPDRGTAPPRPPLAPRPPWAPVAGLAFAALPPWARRSYSLHRHGAAPHGAASLHGPATTAALHALRISLRGVQTVRRP